MIVRHAARLIALVALAALLALGAGNAAIASAAPSASAVRAPGADGTHAVKFVAQRSTRTAAGRRSVAVHRRGVGTRRAAAKRRAVAKRRAAARRRAFAKRRVAAKRRAALERHAATALQDQTRNGSRSAERAAASELTEDSALDNGDATALDEPANASDGGQSPLGAPADVAAPCAGADTPLSPQTATEARAAASCLVNQERARQGLGALVHNPALEAAGQGHAQDMIDRDFFAHVNPSGATVLERIRGAGYLTGAMAFSVGENLALAAGGNATPRTIVDGWMRSPAHRTNILSASFREAGMGLVPAVPRTAGNGLAGGATLVQAFGLRG